MKILMLSFGNEDDLMKRSGTNYNIIKSLRKFNDVDYFDMSINCPFHNLFGKIVHRILNLHYDYQRSLYFTKKMNLKIKNIMSKKEYDLIFSTDTKIMADYNGNVPFVFYSDASFGGMVNYYWNDKKWFAKNYRESMDTETKAIFKASHIFYTTNWAANTANQYHGCDLNKTSIVFRGANFFSDFDKENIEKIIENRHYFSGEFHFLFVGVDWKRKGGLLINESLNILLQRGYKVHLNVVGCNPTIYGELSKYCSIYGKLNRNNRADYEKMLSIFKSSDIYFQPSEKECMGIAYLEASSFALPIIARDTGGVGEVVTCKNGLLMNYNATAVDYANNIEKLLNNPSLYKYMALNGYNSFLKEWNRDSVAIKIQNILENIVEI